MVRIIRSVCAHPCFLPSLTDYLSSFIYQRFFQLLSDPQQAAEKATKQLKEAEQKVKDLEQQVKDLKRLCSEFVEAQGVDLSTFGDSRPENVDKTMKAYLDGLK